LHHGALVLSGIAAKQTVTAESLTLQIAAGLREPATGLVSGFCLVQRAINAAPQGPALSAIQLTLVLHQSLTLALELLTLSVELIQVLIGCAANLAGLQGALRGADLRLVSGVSTLRLI